MFKRISCTGSFPW